MSYTSKWLSIVFIISVLPLLAMGQIHERGMMKNRTNVERESSDYTIGIVKDTTRFRNSMMKFVNSTVNTDDAAESEDDILYASFDSDAIHYPKFNFSNLEEDINIKLVDAKSKQYFAYPCEGIITSRFGPRRRRYHYGIDIGLRVGEPIKCMFDGKVRIAKRAGAYGNLVVIRHDNGLETYYAHLSEINVDNGQTIKAGEILGLGGSTGRSTGPHLHLEIRYLGAAINPEDIVDFKNYTLVSNELALNRSNFRHHSSRSNDSRLANNSSSTKASKGGKSYTVRKGETLASIAKKNGTTVKKLAQMNNIKGNKIKAGQKIKVR